MWPSRFVKCGASRARSSSVNCSAAGRTDDTQGLYSNGRPGGRGQAFVLMTEIFSHRIEVRFSDCDPLGHANNAKYLTYLEQARLAHWRAVWGFGTREDVPGVILARAEIDFRRPARYGDMLDVRIGLAGIGRTSFTYDYEIVDDDGR